MVFNIPTSSTTILDEVFHESEYQSQSHWPNLRSASKFPAPKDSWYTKVCFESVCAIGSARVLSSSSHLRGLDLEDNGASCRVRVYGFRNKQFCASSITSHRRHTWSCKYSPPRSRAQLTLASVHLHRRYESNQTSSRPVVHSLHASPLETGSRYWSANLLHRLASQKVWTHRPTISE